LSPKNAIQRGGTPRTRGRTGSGPPLSGERPQPHASRRVLCTVPTPFGQWIIGPTSWIRPWGQAGRRVRAVCGLLCTGSCARRRSAAASSDLAGAAAHRARHRRVPDAKLGLLGARCRVIGVRGDARHAGRQRRPVVARLLAQVAADRAQGRSGRCGAELRFLGGEGAEVTAVVPSRASNAVAVLHVRRGARLAWLGLG